MPPAENKPPETLPKTLPGVVCAQWVRCGKTGCRCARGQRHLADCRFWREDGRVRKQYIRRTDVPGVRACCQARQAFAEEMKATWAQWRQMVTTLRGTTS